MIYLIRHGDTNYVKIGYSNSEKGVIGRLTTFQTGNPIQLSLLGVVDGTQSTEYMIQSAFADKKIRNEWFDLTQGDIKRILNTKNLDLLARDLINKFLRSRGG